ncbi:MAG: polymorphic toxin-type HINT domain-containing protein [Lachnospiraceae bacterium]|nr:polymorphic toxin-type HINT domain-containing protein [Lachnospiraceae bacterium]
MKHSKKTKQLAIWFLLTVLAFTFAIIWDRSTQNEVSATSSLANAEKTNPSVHRAKIQDIQLGERVVGKNPQENDGLDESILTEIPHARYNLLFKKPDGTYSYIELLCPKNWLETEKIILREVLETTTSDELLKNAIRQKSSDGKDCNIEVYIDFSEMGTVGRATLISIKENIEIKEGPGNVVTNRFRHIANNVIDLLFEGVDKIGCTVNHPIWSVDREAFIEADKLVEGERVLLYNGETRRVVQKQPRPGPQYVNNLEVFGEHVYHVTLNRVLAHNDYHVPYISKKWVKTPSIKG